MDDTETAARLEAALEEDTRHGTVKLSQGGRIHRSHYASMLSVPRHHLTRDAKHVLSEYEDRLGTVAATPDRILSRMRGWLEDAYREGSLGMRDGRVERKGFAEAFRFAGGTFLTRNPKIRQLFDEFDRRAVAEGYVPKGLVGDLERVTALLSSDACPVHRTGLSVDRRKLSALAQISESQLKRSPLAEVIEAKDAEIAYAAELDPLRVLAHGRRFDFRELEEWWPSVFLEAVAAAFQRAYAHESPHKAKKAHSCLRRFLRHVGESPSADYKPLRSQVTAGLPTADALQLAVERFRADVQTNSEQDAGEVTRSLLLTTVGRVLAALHGQGVLPGLLWPVKGIKNAHRRAGHLKSVAEVSQGGQSTDYMQFAKSVLEEKFRSVQQAEADAGGFLHALAEEASLLGDDIPDDPAEGVLAIIDRRLGLLEEGLCTTMLGAMSMIDVGRTVIAHATIDAEFLDAYRRTGKTASARAALVRDHFPKEEQWLGHANLLALAVEHFSGLLPSKPLKEDKLGQFFQKRYLEFGGHSYVESMLNPGKDAYGACLSLYLIGSGANVEVGRGLTVNGIRQSDLPGHVRITGTKARAGDKPIFDDYPEHSPAVEALKWLEEHGQRYRDQLPPEKRELIFAMRFGERFAPMSGHWFRAWFKRFSEATLGVELLPTMIRPSLLLKAAIENDGRVKVGMEIGQHSEEVTQGYQQKWPVRLLYERNIRQYQDSFEALVASHVDEAAVRLGISNAEFQLRLRSARRTGLGTLCLDPSGRPGLDGRECDILDCASGCPQLLLVAETETIATLQMWLTSLRMVQPEWERDRPERWQRVWLPWLCLCEVVEEKMARGPLLAVWRKAERLTDRLRSDESYSPPMPW